MRGGDTRTGGWRMVHDEVHVEEDLNLAQMVEALAAYERQMATAPADHCEEGYRRRRARRWREVAMRRAAHVHCQEKRDATYIASRTGIDTRTVQEIRRWGRLPTRPAHRR